MNWKLIIKIITLPIILPISITAFVIWPKWEKAKTITKILTAPIVLPLALIANVVTPFWDEL